MELRHFIYAECHLNCLAYLLQIWEGNKLSIRIVYFLLCGQLFQILAFFFSMSIFLNPSKVNPQSQSYMLTSKIGQQPT